jgi:hypothetical protein
MALRCSLLILILGLSSAAQAQNKFTNLPARRGVGEPPPAAPRFRIAVTNLLVGRINPLGLEDQLRIGPQMVLYRSDSAALRDNFIFVGFTPRVNPAFVKIGPSVELQIASVLNLRFNAELISWFGTFGLFQSFNSPNAEASDSAISAGRDAGLNYRTSGAHFTFEPLLQAKVGPIAIRNRFSIEYWAVNARPGDTVFYDQTLDTLVPTNGWIVSNDLDVLYLTKFRFVAGVRYSIVQPLYKPSDFQLGEDVTTNYNGHQRIGPLLAYTFFDKGFARFNKPTIILIANWYLTHRYRTGLDVNAGVPYLVLGFAFTSDIIPK